MMELNFLWVSLWDGFGRRKIERSIFCGLFCSPGCSCGEVCERDCRDNSAGQ